MRKIMQKKKPILLSMLAGLSLCLIGGGVLTAQADVDIRDYFEIPSEVQTSAYVGAETKLARIKATDASAKDFKVVLLDESGKEVKLDGYQFVPKKAGVYKCVYTYMLDNQKQEYSYLLNVTVKDGPVFSDGINLPYALMADREYVLPTIEAKDYSIDANGASVDVKVTATCSGEAVEVTNNKFTPVYDKIGSEAVITYTATSNGKTETMVEKLPILNPFSQGTNTQGATIEVVDYTKLFTTNGFENADLTPKALVYSTFANDAEAKFANITHQDGIDFSFGFGENFQAEAITMKVESLEDPSVYTTVTYQKGRVAEGKGRVILNGKDYKDYNYTAEQQLRVQYNSDRKAFIGAGAESLFEVKTDANGNEFNGFPGGDVRVSFTIENVYGNADLAFYKINNLTLKDNVDAEGNDLPERDQTEANLYLPEIPVEYMIGDVITIDGVKAYDVINPNVSIKVTVKLGKEIIKDVNGKSLNEVDGSQKISFTASKHGKYTVGYTLTDGSGVKNARKNEIALYAYDREKPTIVVDGNMPTTAGLNAQVAFPQISATDTQSGAKVELQLIVKWSSGKMRQIAYSKTGSLADVTYSFTKADTYTIMIVAIDESNNYTRQEYTLVVA